MDYLAQYKGLVDGVKLITLFALILLDTLLGVILAVKKREFQWGRLAAFLNSSVLMMAGGYFLVGIFALFEPAYRAAVPLVWLALDAKLVADIVNKLKALGVPVSLKK